MDMILFGLFKRSHPNAERWALPTTWTANLCRHPSHSVKACKKRETDMDIDIACFFCSSSSVFTGHLKNLFSQKTKEKMQSKSASNGEEPSSYSLQTLTEQEKASVGFLELKVHSHSFLFSFSFHLFLSLMRKNKAIILYNLDFCLSFVNLMGFCLSRY